MGVPVVTARITPPHPHLNEGYQTLMAFEKAPAASLWEQSIEPPGPDTGEKIPTTTMFNQRWRTFWPPALIEMTDGSCKGGYSPHAYQDLLAILGINQSVTVHFPNGDTLSFFGFLKEFKPAALEEHKFPEAAFTIVCTNQDPADGSEAAPLFVPGTGT